MKKLLLFLSMSTGMFAARNAPDPFEELLQARQRVRQQEIDEVRAAMWTSDGLREVIRGLKGAPQLHDKPAATMLGFMVAFGVSPEHMHLCRSLIHSLRPEVERALAGGARDITVQLTLPTGRFNRTVSADYARDLIRTYDEINRDMPMDFDRAVEDLKYQYRPSNAELKRQVDAANATVNGVPVQVAVYSRPIPKFVWGLVAVGAAACAYSAYTYFFAKEEKKESKKAAV